MKILKYISTIVLGLITSQNPALGQSTFAKTYGGIGNDWAFSIQQTIDGGFIIAGSTSSFGVASYDVFLIKTDGIGNIQWAKTYGGADWDFAYSVQQTIDGGFIVAGETSSFGAGNDDFFLIKLDENGNIQWAKTYGGKADDKATSVQQTTEGGFILAGITYSFGIWSVIELSEGFWDILLVKTDTTGNVQWAKTYGTASFESAFSIQQTIDKGFVISGSAYTFKSGSSKGDWDFLLIKIDSIGNIQWAKTYGGTSYDQARSVQQTSDGGYILAGITYSFGVGNGGVLLIKTDSDGNVQWAKTYDVGGEDWAFSVQQTADGGFIVVGVVKSSDFLFLIKLDRSGKVKWAKTYWGFAYSVKQTIDGGFIVAGEIGSFGAGDGDFLLIKVDANGNIGSCSIVRNSNQNIVEKSPDLTVKNYPLLTTSPNVGTIANVTVNSPTVTVFICPSSMSSPNFFIPLQFKLFQNYPNPFNSTTTIPFWLPQRTNVILKVYDIFGREIATLINREFDAGEHSIQFNANDLPTGVYFYRLQAGNFIEQKKMILIK
jgi:hypothetical protein